MKVIFLDIDGVMATTSCYGVAMKNKWKAYKFDEKCVAVLNFIIQETGAEIIISSDWRNHYTLQEMREIFAHNFVMKGPIGFTPSSELYKEKNLEGGRSEEIKMWLKHNAWKDDIKWVVIDDLNMSGFLKITNDDDKFFLTEGFEGIKKSGLKDKIISKLVKISQIDVFHDTPVTHFIFQKKKRKKKAALLR
jgi:hypothetical protein